MKRTASLLLALCLLLSLSCTAYAVVGQSESFYVADYAGVLSEDTKQTVIDYNGALEYQCKGAQIVVVTVDYLEGMTSDAYAYQLFNDWGVGSAEENNGMLLLLAVKENKAWLAYGLGLNSRLSESKVNSLLDDYFWTEFDKGNYDTAVRKLFTALLVWYDGVYGSSVVSAGQNASSGGAVPAQQSYDRTSIWNGLRGIIRLLIILAIVISLFGNSYGRRGGFGGILPWLFLFNGSRGRNWNSRNHWDDWPPRGGGGFGGGSGRGGGGFGGFGGGFGGGMGGGGGGFSGGGGGRR